jgi:hypothetical protein
MLGEKLDRISKRHQRVGCYNLKRHEEQVDEDWSVLFGYGMRTNFKRMETAWRL